MNKKTLIIVESPSKCKKIEQYLGNSYKVIASYGHFTKLDSLDQIHFDTYEIKYKIDKSKVLKSIKDEIKRCKEVILATDDDREGEAIAWTLCTFCKLNIYNTKKIVFQEITKEAILRSLENLTHINMDRVKSQQARQILDIYLGYKVSPLLWKYVQHKLSAGRCQTPALRLIYENQKIHDNLTFDTHFQLKGLFTSKRIPFQYSVPIDHENIKKIMDMISKKDKYYIKDKIDKKVNESPPCILITSSLQQKAYNLFRFSPKQTMKYAQELYEGGYITYMRTDSMCYSKEFIDKLREHIIQNYGEKYLHTNLSLLQQNKNKNKSQQAHEGIRVCDLSKEQCEISSSGACMLYKFIYKSSIQCAMTPAIYQQSTFRIYVDEIYNDSYFKHVDKFCTFKGWTILENIKSKESYLDYLTTLYKSQNSFALEYAEANEQLKEQKTHYNESSLIKKLESLNIGRPSTYSSIIESIINKKYVLKGNIEGKKTKVRQLVFVLGKYIEENYQEKSLCDEKNKLYITPIGKQVCEFCYEHFDKVFDYDFTNKMETLLDDIEYGKCEQSLVLNNYISSLENCIKQANIYYHTNPEQISKVKDQSLHCGIINNNPWYIKCGKYGYYLNIGKKDKISLKDFSEYSIEDKINSQELLSERELCALKNYVHNRNTIRNENICVELSQSCSIRKSKYGYYIYYQTKSMKKPKFLKYNDEKDDNTEERLNYILNKDKRQIIAYIMKKYNITI